MSAALSGPGGRVPGWLVAVGSVPIALHLVAVACHALAAPSGPWPGPEGPDLHSPPQFAFSLDQAGPAQYLDAAKLTHNYHFSTSRPGTPGARLEVRLKDAAGNEVATVPVPDPAANPWVRHRQSLLAQWLTNDLPVPPPQSEVIAAPNQAPPAVLLWDLDGNNRLKLKSVPQHLVPRDRPVMRPSEASLLLVRSYARHLCRTHGAASAEVVRHTRYPIPSVVMTWTEVPPGAFDELVSNFGELPR
jgi:hypothetical protein